jgi:hypothetical protein
MAEKGGQDRAAKAALGILLVWLGGALLFVAFMSGKTASLTVGKDSAGKSQGPRDASELVGRIATAVQAAEGNTADTGTGPGPSQGGPV